MEPTHRTGEHVAPIFIIADDDREAIEHIQRRLNVEWYYVPIWETRLVIRYAKHFATTAIFLAEPINYADEGAARLLQDLLDQVGKPVVILSEVWSPEIAAKWKRMGATDCIPQPTRFVERIEKLRSKMEEGFLGNQSPSSFAEGRT
jgi:hypothetical protein